jgi:hypothetical protein
MARIAAVMGYGYFRMNLFISLRPLHWWDVVLAPEHGTVGKIRAQHQLELA